MNRILIFVAIFTGLTFSLNAAEKKTVVLNERDNGKTIEYLEYSENSNFKDYVSYVIKTVYGETLESESKEPYNKSVKKFIMDCSKKLYLFQKQYLFNNSDLVEYTKYDVNYYRDDLNLGWKRLDGDKTQLKISELLCK